MTSKYIQLYRDEKSAAERQNRHLQQLAKKEQRALQTNKDKPPGSRKKGRREKKAARKAERCQDFTKNCKRAYSERNSNLRAIGFESYKAYLRSDLWCGIRTLILPPQTRCHSCTRLATQVHHKSYTIEVLLGQKLDELLPVCGKCHHRAEYTGSGHVVKVDPGYATEKLARQAKITTDNLKRAFERAFDRSWESDAPETP